MNHRFDKHHTYYGTSAMGKTNTIFSVPFNFERLGKLLRSNFNVTEFLLIINFYSFKL
jgi:hypothetical protein